MHGREKTTAVAEVTSGHIRAVPPGTAHGSWGPPGPYPDSLLISLSSMFLLISPSSCHVCALVFQPHHFWRPIGPCPDSIRPAEASAAGGGRLARLAAIEQLRAAWSIPNPTKNRCAGACHGESARERARVRARDGGRDGGTEGRRWRSTHTHSLSVSSHSLPPSPLLSLSLSLSL